MRVDIAGTVESIAQITPEILYRCYNTFYNLHNMALCICGDVTPEQVKAVADEVLKPAPEQEILRQYPDEPDEVCRPRIEESLEVSRPLFNIGIKVTPAGDAAERLRRAAATDILLDMMFGPSSEFYLKNYESGVISGKFGKSYESMADIACILFSGAADDPDKVYDAIREEIGKRRREGFTAEEFNRAKKAVLHRDAFALSIRRRTWPTPSSRSCLTAAICSTTRASLRRRRWNTRRNASCATLTLTGARFR